MYNTAVVATQKFTSKPWAFERMRIFAQTDAFIQRCRCAAKRFRFQESPHPAGYKGCASLLFKQACRL